MGHKYLEISSITIMERIWNEGTGKKKVVYKYPQSQYIGKKYGMKEGLIIVTNILIHNNI
jgi:hypothetical protein